MDGCTQSEGGEDGAGAGCHIRRKVTGASSTRLRLTRMVWGGTDMPGVGGRRACILWKDLELGRLLISSSKHGMED